jgi:hypothetical protein
MIELLALAERRGVAPGYQLAWPGDEVTEWYLLQQGLVCCTTLDQVGFLKVFRGRGIIGSVTKCLHMTLWNMASYGSAFTDLVTSNRVVVV